MRCPVARAGSNHDQSHTPGAAGRARHTDPSDRPVSIATPPMRRGHGDLQTRPALTVCQKGFLPTRGPGVTESGTRTMRRPAPAPSLWIDLPFDPVLIRCPLNRRIVQ